MGDVVRVTSKGQATIPAELRARYGITAPGRVRFREIDGRLVVEPVPRPSEMRGRLKGRGGAGSVVDELLADRAEDLALERRK